MYLPIVWYFVNRKATEKWHIDEMEIDFYNVTFIYKGIAYYRINHNLITVKQGEAICLPQGSFWSAYTDKENPIHCYSFNFRLPEEFSQLPALSRHIVLKNPQRILDLCRQAELSDLEAPDRREALLSAILILILEHLAEESCINSFEDFRIAQIKKELIKVFPRRLTLGELAKQFGLSQNYLGNLFKAQTGETFAAFQNRLVLQRAKSMLADGGSVSAVSELCGFSDVFYFSKLFKRQFGQSPREYKYDALLKQQE